MVKKQVELPSASVKEEFCRDFGPLRKFFFTGRQQNVKKN